MPLIAFGCGDSLPRRVPVSGVVTFDGVPPPAPGVITFSAIEVFDKGTNRPGSAHFDKSGAFAVKTFTDGDGLMPGKYRVRIDCWKHEPEAKPNGELEASYIAAGYAPPDLVVNVDSSAIIDLKYDVPLKK